RTRRRSRRRGHDLRCGRRSYRAAAQCRPCVGGHDGSHARGRALVTLLVRSFVRAPDADQFAGELAAVCGAAVAALATKTGKVPTATEAELRDHARITAQVHRRTASLPARFGVHYESEDALASALGANESRLERELDDVGLRNELSIVLTWQTARSGSASAATRATTGREYL